MKESGLSAASSCLILGQFVLCLPQSRDTSPEAASTESFSEVAFLASTVSGQPPDPLGISAVSGIYGPGVWTAWMVTICLTWCEIISGRNPVADSSFWLFLVGVWWSAIDLMHRTWQISIRNCNGNGGNADAKDMGSLGAAFTVLWVGLLHGLSMILVSLMLSHFRRNLGGGGRTLAALLILPVAGFTAFGLAFSKPSWIFPAENFCLLPAACRKGMTCNNHNGLLFLLWTSLVLDFGTVFGYLLLKGSGAMTWFLVDTIGGKLFGIFLGIVGCLLWIIYSFNGPALALIFLDGVLPPVGITITSERQGCFFMPCAPQSIGDHSQLCALLAVVAYLIFKIGPVLCRMRTKNENHRGHLQSQFWGHRKNDLESSSKLHLSSETKGDIFGRTGKA